MKLELILPFICLLVMFQKTTWAQTQDDPTILTIDRIYHSNEFQMDHLGRLAWMDDGENYTTLETSSKHQGARDIVIYDTKTGDRSILVAADQLIPEGEEGPLVISNYSWSNDGSKLLVFTNTVRVWRYHTKGDYWVLDTKSGQLRQLGSGLPVSSLMFAKFSPDDGKVAYVSKHNLYVEDLASQKITQLTLDGTDRLINGTFDWAYEEEFACRDGFRWSPDGKHLAYWQVDASDIRNFLMINNTDSVYSHTIPVQYPKVGETPSACRLGAISAGGGRTRWMDIPGDNRQHYLPRMQWYKDGESLLVQQLNRKQNYLVLWQCNIMNGTAQNIYEETDPAWIDAVDDWPWLKEGESFAWMSEKDGWRHLYQISADGKKQKLVSDGNYDVINIYEIDAKGGYAYFSASPENPTQRYLYRIPLFKKGKAERLSPEDQAGTHSYNIAPGGRYAIHTFSSANVPPVTSLVELPGHKTLRILVANEKFRAKINQVAKRPAEFFRVKTQDNVEIDGMMIKPPDFNPAKKYPVLFYVYGEPWGQTAVDKWNSNLMHLMLAQKGYIVITMDNRGTPSPRGREWRKSIYRKIGIINSYDQAMATKEVLKWDFIDPERIAVWGWSGGGSMTLNLLFRYPEIYKTGMSVAPVSNQLYYDNIYQERYMGLPSENMEDFIEGSPITYAKNLKGNLLLVHGTGDDNVHYQNSEALINELIKHNKQFQVMPYPNRSHSIYEGENTTRHLYTLLTNYLLEKMPAGERIVKP